MSVKVQAKVNASVDYASLEEELWWKAYSEATLPKARAEMAAWRAVRPLFESQQALRVALKSETDRVEDVKAELPAQQGRGGAAERRASSRASGRARSQDEGDAEAAGGERRRARAAARDGEGGIPLRSGARRGRRRRRAGGGEAAGAEQQQRRPRRGRRRRRGGATTEGGGGRGVALWRAPSRGAHADGAGARHGRPRGGGDEGGQGHEPERGGRRGQGGRRRRRRRGARPIGTDGRAVPDGGREGFADVQRLEDEKQQAVNLEKASEEEGTARARARGHGATLHEVASDWAAWRCSTARRARRRTPSRCT